MKSVDSVLAQYYPVPIPTKALIEAEAHRYAPGHEADFIATLTDLRVAMTISDAIFRAQYDPLSNEVATALHEMNFSPAVSFDRFLAAYAVSGSLYDVFSGEKIEPDFTKEDLSQGYAYLVSIGSALVDAEVSGGSLSLSALEMTLFDPTVAPAHLDVRGFYPSALLGPDRDALLARIKEDAALRSHYTLVGWSAEKELVAVPYTTAYAVELALMSDRVTRAASTLETFGVSLPTDQEEKAQGIRGVVAYLREQDRANRTLDNELVYSDTDRARVRAYKVEQPAPFFLGLFFESNYDDPFKMKMAMTAILSLETEACRELAPFVGKFLNTAALESRIPYTAAIREHVPFVPVLMHDCIYRAGHGAVGPQALAATYRSEDNKVNDEEGVVIVAWRNVIAAKAEAILSPIARTILPAEKVASYGADFDRYLAMAFSIGILSHEQRHFIGERMNELELQARLGERFNDIDEGLAEIGRVYSFRELASDGFDRMDAKALEEFLYDTYFADMFRHMRFGPTSPYRKSAEWRLNYFVQRGIVEVGETVRIVDYDQFKTAVADLYAFHLEVMQTGNREKADAFIEQYALSDGSSLLQQKNALLQRISSKGIPRDIVLQYQL